MSKEEAITLLRRLLEDRIESACSCQECVRGYDEEGEALDIVIDAAERCGTLDGL